MLKAVNGNLIVKRSLPDKQVGGFALPEEMEDGAVCWEGTVICGSETYPKGTKIIFVRYIPHDLTMSDGQNLLVLKETDICAIVEE